MASFVQTSLPAIMLLSKRTVFHTITVLCLFGGPSPITGSPQDDGTAHFFRRPYLNNKIISNSLPTVVGQLNDAVSASGCAAACLAEERCGSFFYVPSEKKCQLHSVLFLNANEADDSAGTSYWQLTQEHCPHKEGFVLYRPLNLCYQYQHQKVSWDDANAFCTGQGTSLLKVNDTATFDHVYKFLRGSDDIRTEHVSIGAREISGVLKWSDGSDVTWTNWAAPSEPSSSLEQCTTMAWFYYFKWNDVPCDDSDPLAAYNFICQKTL